jgi:hypothetical protein
MRRSVVPQLTFAALLIVTIAAPALAGPSIRFNGGGLDVFNFHGRMPLTPPTLGGPVDPVNDTFTVKLSNDFGVIYQASLLPGDLEETAALHYRFKDDAAVTGAGTRDGLYHMLSRFRRYPDGWYYTVRIRAYGDFSFATQPKMKLVISHTHQSASVTALWQQTKNGWRLPLSRFP